MSESKEAGFKRRKAARDVTRIFLVYVALIGDVMKTSAALDEEPEFIEWMAKEEGWERKIKRISVMSQSTKPGDWERAANRAMNWVQAHQTRQILDKVIREFSLLSGEEALVAMSSTDSDGTRRYSARFLAELSQALEKVQNLSYHALGDTLTERMERNSESGENATAAQLHASVIQALNSPTLQKLDTKTLVEAALSSLQSAIPGPELAAPDCPTSPSEPAK